MPEQIGSTEPQKSTDTVRTRRRSVRITDRLVKELAPPENGYQIVYDSQTSGFGIQVMKSGKRSFVLNYRIHGSERRITIGRYPEWSVLAARRRAETFRVQIAQGIDPKKVRDEKYHAPTMKDLYTRFMEQEAQKVCDEYREDIERIYRQHLLPKWGSRKVQDISFSDCDSLHRQISKTRPTRANRILSVMTRAFNLAIKWGWIERNPTLGIEKNKEHKRQHYLTPKEIRRVLEALDAHSERTSCEAIKMILLTGARKGEVLKSSWDQFNEDLTIWSKPAASTKQRKPHIVRVSKPVTELLSIRREQSNSSYVFQSRNGKPLQDVKKTWASITKAAGIEGTHIHDLRHTYASVAISNGVDLYTVGQLLGHTQTQTTARYAHLFDETLHRATETVAEVMTTSTRT